LIAKPLTARWGRGILTIGGNCQPRATFRPGAIEEMFRSGSKNQLEGKVRWRKADVRVL